MTDRQIPPAPDTAQFEVNRQNRNAINAIRSQLVDLSDSVRKNVARWCVQAENQPEFPWHELFSIVQNSDTDMGILMKASSQFKEYAERHLNGRIKDIDLTPLPADSITDDMPAETNSNEIQDTAGIETSNTATVSDRIDANIRQIRKSSGLRSLYSAAHPAKTRVAGGEK